MRRAIDSPSAATVFVSWTVNGPTSSTARTDSAEAMQNGPSGEENVRDVGWDAPARTNISEVEKDTRGAFSREEQLESFYRAAFRRRRHNRHTRHGRFRSRDHKGAGPR